MMMFGMKCMKGLAEGGLCKYFEEIQIFSFTG
jgi:hypothetical protein